VAAEVVGRQPELDAAAEFIEQVARGPAVLAFEGEAGIGKTTVWRAACDLAKCASYGILTTRPAEPDRQLSFVGLTDLFSELEARLFADLPDPQRLALDAALLRGHGRVSNSRAVYTAVLTVLTRLASEVPLVLAVDDLQWLDPASARALEFASRRLTTQRVGLLLASRLGELGDVAGLSRASAGRWSKRLGLESLSLAGTQRLLKDRLECSYSRPTLLRVHESSGGNPFFALELARALGPSDPKPGQPLPVPADVHRLVRQRIERLPARTRRALLRASALSQPNVNLVGAALGPARREGLVDLTDDGEVVFAHPLYASAVYEVAPPDERRRCHRELARRVTDLEERARHLALGTRGPDESVAEELDRAADRAGARGAPEMAAQLWELAAERTDAGADADYRRRARQAADAHIRCGAISRAGELLRPLVDEAPSGDERAELLIGLMDAARDWEEMSLLSEHALDEAVSDAVRSKAHVAVGWAIWPERDIDFALHHGRLALQCAERSGDTWLLLETLGSLSFWELVAGRMTPGMLDRAVELKKTVAGGVLFSGGPSDPRFVLALRHLYQGRLDSARELMRRLLDEAAAEGNEPQSILLRFGLVNVDLRSGNWRRAAARAADTFDDVEQIGPLSFGGMHNYWKALVDVHLGRVAEARAAARAGVDAARAAKHGGFMASNLSVLGFLELSLGNESGALVHLRPQLDWVREKKGALATHPSDAYALEALVGGGCLAEAAEQIDRFEAEAQALESPWALAGASRCRGLLAAAAGDFTAALTAFETAVGYQEHGAWPFERARTLLFLGRTQRRAKQKAPARTSLQSALETFDLLPAPLWAERVREELARLGLRRGERDELTETERRVAELAASGLKNREVAARLFISPKTVEANLARAYRKLGIRSRAELGARLTRMVNDEEQA
jgi:DNA-binding CsgD family transcriptional regulator